jgi:hypothetical protein
VAEWKRRAGNRRNPKGSGSLHWSGRKSRQRVGLRRDPARFADFTRMACCKRRREGRAPVCSRCFDVCNVGMGLASAASVCICKYTKPNLHVEGPEKPSHLVRFVGITPADAAGDLGLQCDGPGDAQLSQPRFPSCFELPDDGGHILEAWLGRGKPFLNGIEMWRSDGAKLVCLALKWVCCLIV